MKKFLLLSLAMLFFCQHSFAQFTSKNGEYEIYMLPQSDISSSWIMVVHFMDDEAVFFTTTDWHCLRYKEFMNILTKDPDALDKWVRGNSDYNYKTYKYKPSFSSSSDICYSGIFVTHLRYADHYSEVALLFSKDHQTCTEKSVYNGKLDTSTPRVLIRKELSDFISTANNTAKNKLQQRNKTNDGVIYE